MRLKEDAIHADGKGSARKRTDELPASAGALAGIGLLHRVRGIVEHRTARAAQDRQRTEVHHQVAVAEHCPPLGQPYLASPSPAHLFDGVRHALGRHELPLLDVDRLARLPSCHEQIGLPAEECRNLQHVHKAGGSECLLGRVHIRKHGNAVGVPDLGEQLQCSFVPNAGEGVRTGAVRLAVGCLEDQLHAQFAAQRHQMLSNRVQQLARFHYARTGNDLQAGHRVLRALGLLCLRRVSLRQPFVRIRQMPTQTRQN
jgi:hypothetical protein